MTTCIEGTEHSSTLVIIIITVIIAIMSWWLAFLSPTTSTHTRARDRETGSYPCWMMLPPQLNAMAAEMGYWFIGSLGDCDKETKAAGFERQEEESTKLQGCVGN